MTKEERKQQAEKLYRDGWTMKCIGDALGVSKETISRDLANLNIIGRPHVKTASNPRGSGRRKGIRNRHD